MRPTPTRTAAARNLLRLQVLPLLRKLNPRVVEHMSRSGRRGCGEMEDGLEDADVSGICARCAVTGRDG